MKPLSQLVRPNIQALQPYSTARDEYAGGGIDVWLDANESPYDNGVNRYPDPHQRALKALIAELKGVDAGRIFIGNGSDEAIDLAFRIFCRPGLDNAVSIAPTYGMYRVAAATNDVQMREVPLGAGYSLPVGALLAAADERTKLMWLCSPNNPTGAVYTRKELAALAALLEKKSAQRGEPVFLIADEPYRELAYDGEEVPFIPAIYKDTIYCYSFSKTLSLPGERIGFLAIHPELTDYARVRAAIYGAGRALGYINASTMFQLVAAECVGQTADISVYKQNRDLIHTALLDMGYTCVKPSGAFYLFLKTPEPDATAFCKKAMALDLLVVPGDEFGCPGYVRLAYCVPKTMLERSLPRFRQLADQYGLKK